MASVTKDGATKSTVHRTEMQDLVLTPAALVRHGPEIAVEGLPEVRAFLGLTEDSQS